MSVAADTIASGTVVTWQVPSRDGRIARSVRTVVTSDVQPVYRTDGRVVDCVTLACFRFVPVDQLVIGEVPENTRPVKEGLSAGARTPEQARTSAVREVSRPAEESGKSAVRTPQATAPQKTAPRTTTPSPPAAKPAANHVPCHGLAIDFLNLLVRAFHAGKPTDTHAVRSMFQTVANAIRTLNPRHVVFAMDGGHDVRSRLLPEYKAHRPEPEPLLQSQKQLAEQALQIAGFQTVRVAGWEADDVLASLATLHPQTVICSSDKDLLSLAGIARVFHPWGPGEFVTPESKLGLPAGQVSDYLALCGDTSDGVPGVKGIGPKTAAQLLQDHESLEGILAAAVTGEIKGATGQRLREQREAALVCRQVVALNVSLSVPPLRQWAPVAGWQQRLQDLRLGSVAAIVESVSELMRIPSPDPVPLDPETEYSTAAPAPPAADPPARGLYRSIDTPLRELRSVLEKFDGPDKGLIWIWESGRMAAGTDAGCPWKAGTVQHTAWLQGARQQNLELTASEINGQDPVAPTAAVVSEIGPSVSQEKSAAAGRVARSLF